MNEKMRKALGFLGLVEDDYNDYGSSTAARPFPETQAPADNDWSPRPAQRPSGLRPMAPPNPSPQPRPSLSISILDANGQVVRSRPVPAPPTAMRGVQSVTSDLDVEVFAPVRYNEANRITDQLRINRAIVLNVARTDVAERRRIIDFTAGTAYALSATIETLEKGAVYLICPHGVQVSPEVRARLRASRYQAVGGS